MPAPDPTRPHANVIELRLRELGHLFSPLDPSPPESKDLEPGVEEFIVSWARQLHRHGPFVLRVHLTGGTPTDAELDVARAALATYFGLQAEYARRRLRQLLREGVTSLGIGLGFLAVCMATGDWLTTVAEGNLTRILGEGLLIGGWVAMWKPMQTFLYDWWPLRREWRLFERLAAARVEVLVPGGVA